MPECPECNKDIQELDRWEVGTCRTVIRARMVEGISHPVPDYGDMDFKPVFVEIYRCPKCSGILFTNLKEALIFLSGN